MSGDKKRQASSDDKSERPPKRRAIEAIKTGEAPKTTEGPAAPTSRTYVIEGDKNIPFGLGNKRIAECVLEFLDVGALDDAKTDDPKRSNHCMLRLIFSQTLQADTPYAPAGTRGVVLNIEPDDIHESTATGKIHLKTFHHPGVHARALKVYDLPVRGDQRVRDFVRIVKNSGMVPCSFNARDDSLVGCKDFMSQLIHRLNNAKILKLPNDAATSVFGQFNLRRNKGVPDTPNPVRYAIFRKKYKHLPIDGINYYGKKRFIKDDSEEEESTESDEEEE